MSINEETFEVLHHNLVLVRPEYESRDIILCPICLTEIRKDDVLRYGVEHIVPKVIVKKDTLELAGTITQNQRCGITVLCRHPRIYGPENKHANQGCNGLKGSLYDWALGRVMNGEILDTSKLAHRHYVAVLIMGYLAAFQTYGYEYILRPELDDVRRQFHFPDITVCSWLEYVRIFDRSPGIYTTENGMPFILGGLMHKDAALEIMFNRFSVALPGGYEQQRSFTKDIETLLRR